MGSWRKWSLFALLIAAAVIVNVSGTDDAEPEGDEETGNNDADGNGGNNEAVVDPEPEKAFKCYEHLLRNNTKPPLPTDAKDCTTCCIIREVGHELERKCATDAQKCEKDNDKKVDNFGLTSCTNDFCNGPPVKCYVHESQDENVPPQPTETKDDCRTCCTIEKTTEDNKNKLKRSCEKDVKTCENDKNKAIDKFGLTRCTNDFCNGPPVKCYVHESKKYDYKPEIKELQDCNTCCIITKEEGEKVRRGCAAIEAAKEICVEADSPVKSAVGKTGCKNNHCNGLDVFQCYKHESQGKDKYPDKAKKEECNTCCTIEAQGENNVLRKCAAKGASCEEGKVNGADGSNGCLGDFCNGPNVFKCYEHKFKDQNAVTEITNEDCNTCCTIEKGGKDNKQFKRDCSKDAKICNQTEVHKGFGVHDCQTQYCNGPKVFKCYEHASQDNTQKPTKTKDCNTCCTIEENEKKLERHCAPDLGTCQNLVRKIKIKDFGFTGCKDDYCNGPQAVITPAPTLATDQTSEANETITNTTAATNKTNATTTTGTTATTTVTAATTTAKAEAGSTKKPTTTPPKQAGGDGLRPLVTALLFPTLAFFLR